MASLNSLVASVQDALDKPFDFMLQLRAEDAVIGCRAILMRQEYTKTRRLPSYALYEAVIPISLEDCGCKGGYTTEGTFPDILFFKEMSPFTFVGSDGRQSISYILPEEIEIYQHNPISGKMPRYTFMNKKPYLFNTSLDNILFRGPFTDPRQLKKYDCGDTCFNEEDDNFFEEHLRSVIVDMVLKELGVRKTDEHSIMINGGV